VWWSVAQGHPSCRHRVQGQRLVHHRLAVLDGLGEWPHQLVFVIRGGVVLEVIGVRRCEGWCVEYEHDIVFAFVLVELFVFIVVFELFVLEVGLVLERLRQERHHDALVPAEL
jgi:hypothetical protein